MQGAGEKSYLPHAKIEAVIREMGFAHTFVRPSYFMENFFTTLAPELSANNRVYLPSSDLKFNWISVDDVAACSIVALLGQVDRESLRICSINLLAFSEALEIVNYAACTNFRYVPASLPGFIIHERRRGTEWNKIAILLLLHYLPRFGSMPVGQSDVELLLGRPAETLGEWADRHVARFQRL